METRKYYSMKQYLDLLQDVMDNGEFKGDRTGTGTLSVFGRQIRFDLSKGFPLVTTKKTHLKSIIHELIWLLSGDTNIKYLRENNVRIWDEWADENGDLGPVYGKQWRCWEVCSPVWGVHPKKKKVSSVLESPALHTPIISDEKGKLTGYINKKSNFEVLSLTGDKCGEHLEYYIKFIKTGNVQKVSSSRCRTGGIKDLLSRTIANVGYIEKLPSTLKQKKLFTLWRDMINRCYQPSSSRYKFYGYKGVTVATRWHSFKNFIDDLPRVPGYTSFEEGYQLDKDYYGSNQYGPTTCVFLPPLINRQIQIQTVPVEYNGNMFPTIQSAAIANNLSRSTIRTKLKAGNVKKIQVEENEVFRPEVYVDQFLQSIRLIRQEPDSRRNVISDWNAGEADKGALHCCHGNVIQFYVSNGKLSCQMYQRSADLFLGVPFNIASYALLTMMMAQVTGLEPGDFVHIFGDAHIYSNHMDQIKLQLSREPRKLPTMKINPLVTNLFDFKYEDFTLEGYDPHPLIKGKVAI